MDCLLCENTIDHLKEFPVVYHAQGKDYDEKGQRDHSAQLNQWQQVLVTVGPGQDGPAVIMQGHVCPDHKPGSFEVNLALKGGK